MPTYQPKYLLCFANVCERLIVAHREKQTVKYFSPSPESDLISKNLFRSSHDLQIFWKSSV